MHKRRTVLDFVDDYFRRIEHMAEKMFSGWNEMACSIEPLSNVLVGANEVIVTVDLPYVNSETVKLKLVADDTLEVSAKTSRKICFSDLGVKHRHGEFSCYHCVIHVPVPVDERAMISKFKRGILEIRVPRIL